MSRVLDAVAPRGFFDGIVKVIAFLTLINGFNMWIVGFSEVKNATSFGGHVIMTTLVSLPFTLFGFFLLARLRRMNTQIRQMAEHDGLTGLLNRATFMHHMRQRLATEQSATLMLMDADHFKAINDTYGHQAGDSCLAAIAARITQTLDSDDLAGRIGGEEFAVFFSGTSCRRARFIADQLTERIVHPDQTVISVTLSIGIAVGSRNTTFEDLYRQADAALYSAKHNGRARAEYYDPRTQHRRATDTVENLRSVTAS